MKTGTLFAGAVLGWAAAFMGTTESRAQGSLTPVEGPGPTMKTLAQVEPRTPIGSAPFTISLSGSYYLTANLTSTGHGVVVAASDVTLDLMGFTLAGNRSAAHYGVHLAGTTNAPVRQVVVRNGFLRGFDSGVRAANSHGCRFESLAISSNLACGVLLDGTYGQCNGNAVAGCSVSDNGGEGIRLDGSFGLCDENIVSGCVLRKNGGKGVTVLNGDGNRVEGNHVSSQTGSPTYGIYCEGSARNLILRNTCVGNTNNYVITANDTYGPVVIDTGALGTTGAAAHPWANFSR